MKKISQDSLPFPAKDVTSFAKYAVVDPKPKSALNTAYQNVQTEFIDVDGTDFYYRKLGENNSGVPAIFLNHLGATLDNCDPIIMDGIASQHQIISFDNRGVGATNGETPKTIAEMATDARAFIHAWGLQAPQDLSVIRQPVLVANGDNDRMVPSSNTYDLRKRIYNSEIIVYKDAGHGGIFQYHEEFVKRALVFLK